MKKWILYLGVFLAVSVVWGMPFNGTDVAKLQPVRLLQVSLTADGVKMETETGDVGEGKNVKDALEDMKHSASGMIFLETAEFLLISDGARELIPELTGILRPGCAVCIVTEPADLEQAAQYLGTHRPEVTLNDCRAEGRSPAHLMIQEGRMELETSKD